MTTLATIPLSAVRATASLCMGTLGKFAGVAGAFVAAHPTIIDWLVQVARPFIYKTAAPPAIAHTPRASTRLLRGDEGEQRRAQLAALITLLRRRLADLIAATPQLGRTLAESATATQPLIVGDTEAALALSAALESRGLWVPAIQPPTVPVGSARLRITLSASHTEDDVLRLVDALEHAAKGWACTHALDRTTAS
jgi:8-amino-7-oxononanoate synthase